jgi:hypothetical protein
MSRNATVTGERVDIDMAVIVEPAQGQVFPSVEAP